VNLIQQDDFFSNLNFILPEIKKIKLHSPQEYNKISKIYNTWPGYRSLVLSNIHPILHEYIVSLMTNKKLIPPGEWMIQSMIHLITENSVNNWIHKDIEHDYSGLIYISNTNLNSGTYLYNDNQEIINDIKFVQNRFIMYNAKTYHMGYGHHGSSIDDGRLTVNLFLNKL